MKPHDPERESQDDIGAIPAVIAIAMLIVVAALCRWIDKLRNWLKS